MTTRLESHGSTRPVKLPTTVLQLLKEQEMVFLRSPSPDPSPRRETCSVGGRPSVQQGQRITANRSVLTRIQQEAKGKASPEVAGHPDQRIRIHLLPVDRLAEVSQALPTTRQQGHVPLKESQVIEGTADRHVQLPQVLPIGLITTGCCFVAAQLRGPVLQSRNQLLSTGRILQAKNQIGLGDKRIGAPGEIKVCTI